jgi:BirA family biotin operon repressor/biotin-[acetyl-CoA-carboxylase] ligase
MKPRRSARIEQQMRLTQAELSARLSPRPLRLYPQVGSTQDLARTWLEDGAPDGAVVIADEQTAGRGRQQRPWQTPAGSAVALSLVLHPDRTALPQVMMLGAIAVLETVETYGADAAGLKWPNDVLINGRKVAGVLPEAVWSEETLEGVVLGVGVNVDVDFSGTDLADKAASLNPALETSIDRAELIERLLARVDHWRPQLGTPPLFDAWKSRLNNLGQQVTIKTASAPLVGRAEAVDEAGALLLRTEHGVLHRVVAGELTRAPGD